MSLKSLLENDSYYKGIILFEKGEYQQAFDILLESVNNHVLSALSYVTELLEHSQLKYNIKVKANSLNKYYLLKNLVDELNVDYQFNADFECSILKKEMQGLKKITQKIVQQYIKKFKGLAVHSFFAYIQLKKIQSKYTSIKLNIDFNFLVENFKIMDLQMINSIGTNVFAKTFINSKNEFAFYNEIKNTCMEIVTKNSNITCAELYDQLSFQLIKNLKLPGYFSVINNCLKNKKKIRNYQKICCR